MQKKTKAIKKKSSQSTINSTIARVPNRIVRMIHRLFITDVLYIENSILYLFSRINITINEKQSYNIKWIHKICNCIK